MAILKIARMGHPVLQRPADPIEDPTSAEVALLVEDMIDTLDDAGGIGLAAPQVHVAKRVVIFFVPEHRAGEEDEEEAQPLTVMINPVIEPLTDEKSADWEACLSVPDLMGVVPRFDRIKYRWTDLEGNPQERIASGFHARAVQHECDHLDGILYPMRMTDLSQLGFAEEIHRNRQAIAAARKAAE